MRTKLKQFEFFYFFLGNLTFYFSRDIATWLVTGLTLFLLRYKYVEANGKIHHFVAL